MVDEHQSWHLDKRVPISLILTIAVQTVVIVWWAASMENRVVQLEANSTMYQNRAQIDQVQYATLNTKLSNLEVRFAYFDQMQTDMKSDIRTLINESREN